MEVVSLKLEVPQEVYRLQKAMLVFTFKLATLKEKGWVVGQDDPQVMAAMADLYAELGHVEDVRRILTTDKMSAISGFVAGCLDV